MFTLSATGFIASVGLVACWILWRHFSLGLVGTDRSTTLFDLARSTVTLLGVLTVGGAAAVAYRRQQTLERQHQIAEEHARLERDQELRAGRADLHARYQQAAAQLGHDEPIIRVAGIYALEALATEWVRIGDTVQRDVCIDLLCGYLRSARGIAPGDVMDAAEEDVRSTVATVIARHVGNPADGDGHGDWSEHDYDFSGVNAYDAWFSSAQFHDYVVFTGSEFHGHAWFTGAQFRKAAWFSCTYFQNGATFSSVQFRDDVYFGQTHFHDDAEFGGTHFHERADFSGAHFHAAAGFDGAQFHGENEFVGAHFHGPLLLGDSDRAQPRRPDLHGALIIPEHLTTALRQLGAAELPESIDCDECQEVFAARSVSK